MITTRERTTLTHTLVQANDFDRWLDELFNVTGVKVNPNDLPWEGEMEKTTSKGGLFTRIETWLFKEKGVKLYSQDRSQLSNNLYKSLVFPGLEVEVDDRFDWAPGEFGDKKSCFFGGKRQAWFFIKHLGGAALKVYRDGKGAGRCLMLPYAGNPDYPILFNAYGTSLKQLAAIYSDLFGEMAGGHWADLSVDGKCNKPVHINDCGGYLIGDLDGDPIATNHSAQQWIDSNTGDYKIFCELCYNELEYEETSRQGRGNYIAHICDHCYQHNKSVNFTDGHFIDTFVATHPRKGEARPKRQVTYDFGDTSSSGDYDVALDMPILDHHWTTRRLNIKITNRRLNLLLRKLAHHMPRPDDTALAATLQAILQISFTAENMPQLANISEDDIPRWFNLAEALTACLIYYTDMNKIRGYIQGLIGDGRGVAPTPDQLLRSAWTTYHWNGDRSNLSSVWDSRASASWDLITENIARIFLRDVPPTSDLAIYAIPLTHLVPMALDMVQFGERLCTRKWRWDRTAGGWWRDGIPYRPEQTEELGL